MGRSYARCLPHVPVEVDFVAEEQVDETGDVLLRTVGVGKTNVIESFEFSCRQGRSINFTANNPLSLTA